MQSTNFEFLRTTWAELANLGAYAEHYVDNDPSSARVKSRILAEQIAIMTCTKLNIQITNANFLSMLQELKGTNLIPKSVLDMFHHLRLSGNKAAHALINTEDNALKTVQTAFDLARWWVRINTGSMLGIPTEFKTIQSTDIPNLQHEVEQGLQLKALNEQLIKDNEILLQKEQKRDTSKDNEFKENAEQSANSLNFNEQETRKYLIDTMLMAAGWDTHNPDDVGIEVELKGQATETGIGFADYVLYGDDGNALAVIEAKGTSNDARIGRKQAQGYANALQLENNGIRPLIILTNGYETFLVDDQGGPQSLGAKGYADRTIFGIPAKESLDYRVNYQRAEMQDPAKMPLRLDIAGRPYQIEALKAVTERFGEQY